MTHKAEQPDLSVVVPVYNTEAYLRSCLTSLASQTLDNMEVVMVDDGSSDGSVDIMKEFDAKYPRFKIVQRENGGLSTARNTGIQHASGRYIGFVDSDDFVDHNMFETLIDTAHRERADIVKSGVLLFNNQTGDILDYRTIPDNKRVIEGPEDALKVFLEKEMNIVVVNGIYKRDLFSDFGFVPGVTYEDHYFTPGVMARCSRFVQIDSIHYYYRKRSGSLSHKVDRKGKKDKIQSMNELYRIIQKTGIPEVFAPLYAEYFLNMAVSYHNSMIYSDPFSLRKYNKALHSIIDTDVFRFIRNSGNLSGKDRRALNVMCRSHGYYFILQKALRLSAALKGNPETEKRKEHSGFKADADKQEQYRSYINKYL